jgi:hypothetical protein
MMVSSRQGAHALHERTCISVLAGFSGIFVASDGPSDDNRRDVTVSPKKLSRLRTIACWDGGLGTSRTVWQGSPPTCPPSSRPVYVMHSRLDVLGIKGDPDWEIGASITRIAVEGIFHKRWGIMGSATCGRPGWDWLIGFWWSRTVRISCGYGLGPSTTTVRISEGVHGIPLTSMALHARVACPRGERCRCLASTRWNILARIAPLQPICTLTAPAPLRALGLSLHQASHDIARGADDGTVGQVLA